MAFRSKFMTSMVLTLLSVVFVLSVISLLLYVQIDNIVNVDLYSYGLQLNYTWFSEYRLLIQVFWASLGAAIIMVVATFATNYDFTRGRRVFSRLLCTLLPLAVAGLMVFAISLILRMDVLINSTLYQYGLQLDSAWVVNYWIITKVTIALMAISFPLFIAITILTGVNTGMAVPSDKANVLRSSSIPNSHNVNRTKRSASISAKKYLAIGIVAIIVTTALLTSFSWKSGGEINENNALEEINRVEDKIDDGTNDVLNTVDDEITDLIDDGTSFSPYSSFALFAGAYADYYGKNTIMNNTFTGFTRLEVIQLNETYASLLFYIGIDNEFQIILDYEDYVTKPLNEIGYEVNGMSLENILPEEQANFAQWGARNCTVYEYSFFADTETAGKTTIFLDNEFKWPLKITIEIDVEGDRIDLELPLDNTNIEWLE